MNYWHTFTAGMLYAYWAVGLAFLLLVCWAKTLPPQE